MARDNRKRATSPPSFFFARVRGLVLAAEYFTDERLVGGYSAVAAKHRHRFQSALFGQVMAAFEWCIKDFFAQVIDATDLFDLGVEAAKWITLDKSRILAQRETAAGIGALLVHPTLGWHDPREVNRRYQAVFGASPIANTEIASLERLWLLRHSVAHNGGLITHHDAYRMGAPHLAGETARIDAPYIVETQTLLREIVGRLASPVGDKIIERWLVERSSGDWASDHQAFSALKMLTTAEPSRSKELPQITQEDWQADKVRFGV